MNTSSRLSLDGRTVAVPLTLNGGAGNAIGLPHGAFGFNVALAKAQHIVRPDGYGTINPAHRPNLINTEPAVEIPENPSWDDHQIITFQSRGHLAQVLDRDLFDSGWNFYPTIAVTKSRFIRPDIRLAMQEGRLKSDGKILESDGMVNVTDINIDPVWRLSAVARRLGFETKEFRKEMARLLQNPALGRRMDLDYYLPATDGPNVHIFGDPAKLADPDTMVHARSHDYCRDGDNWAARCTCAPYKTFAIEEMIKAAQDGQIGILVMNAEEGRGLGSVTKHLVYNQRERHPDGDHEDRYWEATQSVAGGVDARFDWAKSDVFHWLLKHRRIDRWYSESHHKRSSLERAGIQIVLGVDLPEDRIPPTARVEMLAKRNSGYGNRPTHSAP